MATHLEGISESDNPLEHAEVVSLLEHEQCIPLLFGTTSNAPAHLVAIVRVEESSLNLEQTRLVDQLLRLGVDGGGVED